MNTWINQNDSMLFMGRHSRSVFGEQFVRRPLQIFDTFLGNFLLARKRTKKTILDDFVRYVRRPYVCERDWSSGEASFEQMTSAACSYSDQGWAPCCCSKHHRHGRRRHQKMTPAKKKNSNSRLTRLKCLITIWKSVQTFRTKDGRCLIFDDKECAWLSARARLSDVARLNLVDWSHPIKLHFQLWSCGTAWQR
jgi:hypothetical protein